MDPFTCLVPITWKLVLAVSGALFGVRVTASMSTAPPFAIWPPDPSAYSWTVGSFAPGHYYMPVDHPFGYNFACKLSESQNR